MHRALTAREFPEVPLKWPPTPPFPACLASRNSLGFPTFSYSTPYLGLNSHCRLLPGIPGHCPPTPPQARSLTFLASSTPLGPPGILALQQSQSTAPRAFELPGAQVYCQRRFGSASPRAAHTFWASPGGARCSHLPSPPPTPKCPRDRERETRERRQCSAPTLPEGGSAKTRKEASMFWTERRPDLCQQQDMERVCAFLRRRRVERRRRGKSRKQEQTKKRLREATWGVDDERHSSVHSRQVPASQKVTSNHSTAHMYFVVGLHLCPPLFTVLPFMVFLGTKQAHPTLLFCLLHLLSRAPSSFRPPRGLPFVTDISHLRPCSHATNSTPLEYMPQHEPRAPQHVPTTLHSTPGLWLCHRTLPRAPTTRARCVEGIGDNTVPPSHGGL